MASVTSTAFSSPWLPSEEKYLLDFVEKSGRRWAVVSKEIPGKTGRDCKLKYAQMTHQIPTNRVTYPSSFDCIPTAKVIPKKNIWSKEEIEALKKHVEVDKLAYNVIGQKLGKDGSACRGYYESHINVKGGPWSEEEIETLINLSKKFIRSYDGYHDWKSVGRALQRSPQECKIVYDDLLKAGKVQHNRGPVKTSSETRGRWKFKEIDKLMDLVLELGENFELISAEFPNRSSTACQLQYFTKKNKIKDEVWPENNLEELKRLVTSFEDRPVDWAFIGYQLNKKPYECSIKYTSLERCEPLGLKRKRFLIQKSHSKILKFQDMINILKAWALKEKFQSFSKRDISNYIQ